MLTTEADLTEHQQPMRAVPMLYATPISKAPNDGHGEVSKPKAQDAKAHQHDPVVVDLGRQLPPVIQNGKPSGAADIAVSINIQHHDSSDYSYEHYYYHHHPLLLLMCVKIWPRL